MRRRIFMVIIANAVLFVPCVSWADAHSDIRSALAEVMRLALPGQLEDDALLHGFEVGECSAIGSPSEEYAPLVSAMSNHWAVVLSNCTSFATSRVERILVQNTGWYMSQDIYLRYLEILTGKVERGEIELSELNGFLQGSWKNHPVSSVVYRRYQETEVSNLVLRIQSLGIATNWCSRVLSGHALQRYEFAEGHGVLEPL